ncbi:hypothetical protein NJB1808e29_25690 [Mycobacterium marinum]|nr:hypothetical protein NJB1808e29_25690 [Mycobacterium marinum]GJP24789.1 hypothetical protein NJB1808_33750 [Mycobacterium marinum]
MRNGFTLEGRQHHATPVAVHIVVDYQQRTLSEQSGQHRVGFAGMKDARVSGEHLLDHRRIGHIDHGAQPRHTQRENAAVATFAGGEESRGVPQHERSLHRAGKTRSGWQAGFRRC